MPSCTWAPAQVTRQPPGTYSVRGHFVRVLPVFAWPPAAWVVHAAVMYLTSWKGRRDAARLQRAQERMRKMLTDLKARPPCLPAAAVQAASAASACTAAGGSDDLDLRLAPRPLMPLLSDAR
jgi:hypothetical protein